MKYLLAAIATATVLLGAGCSPVQTGAPKEKANDEATPSAGPRLDLSGQNLTELPKIVLNRIELHELDVSNNRLTGALPAEIRQLAALEVLDASGNVMTGLPAEIGQLKNLRVLDLSDNRLTGLPLELGNLTKLQKLDLRGNLYSKYDLDIIRKSLPSAVILVDGNP